LRGVIADTLSPRLAEMLIAVRDRLARAGFVDDNAPTRAVLVGGVSQIPGVRALAAEALGMPVRVGRPVQLCGFEHGEAGPAYAAAAGLLRWRLDNPTLDDVDYDFQPSLSELGRAMRGGVSNAWNWLRENF
jgi:cell division protein FtsA